MTDELVFYTNPMSRGRIVRWMLEEIGQPYRTEVLDFGTTMKAPEYLKVNPMGKVPAIRHGDALITEQVAIYLYLADLVPEAGLAPAIGDPLRGPYLRWMVYYGSCVEPAIVDKAMKRDPAPLAMCPYGDYDTMLKTLTDQLAAGPYVLGERFSAVDVLWGTALTWITNFDLIPKSPVIVDYLARVNARPSVAKIKALDAELAATLVA